MQGLHLVGSSGWLEFLVEGPNAAHFAEPLSDPARVVVPTISLYEVFRVVLRKRGEHDALRAASLMQQGREVPLSSALALEAARLADALRLAMADAVILATAHGTGATLWTQDVDFEGIEGVRYFAKSPG